MKKLLLLIIALLNIVAVGGVQAQNIVQCSAKIHSVDVYASGGKLYMRGSVNLKAGINKIEIAGIPRGARSYTLQAGISGSGVEIHSSIIAFDQNIEKPDAQTEKFKAQIEVLQRDNELVNLKIKTIDEQLSILKKQCSTTNEVSQPSVEYVSSVVDVLGKKMNDLQAARFELDAKIKANNEQLSRIEQLKSEYREKRYSLGNIITIVAQSDSEKAAQVAVEFITNDITWSPYYEVQINGAKCEIITKAKVSQSTVIDWNSVSLSLLSSNLSANSAALPVVYTEYVPQYVAPVAVNTRMMKYSQAMPQQEESEDEYVEETVVAAAYGASRQSMAYAETSYNMQNFKLSVPYSIASGGSADIKLTSQDIPVTMEYLIMPTQSTDAYFVANLTVSDMFNKATANIYLDGTFIGTQALRAYQMAENGTDVVIKLSLGTDNGVFVKTDPKSTHKGNVTSTARTTTVVNNKERAIDIKIVERYPISRENSVKVEDVVISEGSTKGNGEGIINWLVNLQPKANVVKSISYNVKDSRKN